MLTFDRVRKSYGAAPAVEGLTLEVRRGEIFGLLGPNGAGKSTTVHLAVGLFRPDSGEVRLDGGDPADPEVRRKIGLAPQAIALYEQLTGRENLEFFGRTYGLSGAALASRVGWALEFVRLVDRAKDRVDTYSGGMKRRLNIAAAMVHDPGVILLDEPTVGVDPQSRNAIFDSIKALRADGRTVIYTTHYMEEAERLCDRVGVMDRGTLLALDTVDALITRHAGAPRLVLHGAAGEERIETSDPLAELNRRAAAAPIAAFRLERPTLEEVFLRLTGRTLRD